MTVSLPTSQLLVLVVDDSATSRVVIEKQLKKLGCNVMTAQDGTSGLAAMEKNEFDLVLLDCQMPDMSGYDVARQVRKKQREEESFHIPIIAISAETDAAHMQLCLESGMDGVLGKPLPEVELKKILSLWCDIDVPSTASVTVEEMKSVDLQELFRTTSIDDLKALRASAQQSDMFAVGRFAHRMKGAALTMNAGHIVATLERIEAIATSGTRGAVGGSDLAAEVDALQQQLQAI